MPNRLTWPGALVYAGVAVALAIEVVHMIRQDDYWAGEPIWASAWLVASAALTGLLFGASAIVRRPLVDGDGPWFTRYGWRIVLALALLSFLASLAISEPSYRIFTNGPALIVPWWIRRLEESYREGIEEGMDEGMEEARREARARREG
ncbi:MAG TPA: hypothetical protein VGD34_01475 [Kribbella sp.]